LLQAGSLLRGVAMGEVFAFHGRPAPVQFLKRILGRFKLLANGQIFVEAIVAIHQALLAGAQISQWPDDGFETSHVMTDFVGYRAKELSITGGYGIGHGKVFAAAALKLPASNNDP
jgi:hypothetical protein